MAPAFIQKNLVLIVMVPLIIGSHVGWMFLQHNNRLVPEGPPKEPPFIAAPKKILQFFSSEKPTKKAEDK